jgi:hypothetical protein
MDALCVSAEFLKNYGWETNPTNALACSFAGFGHLGTMQRTGHCSSRFDHFGRILDLLDQDGMPEKG